MQKLKQSGLLIIICLVTCIIFTISTTKFLAEMKRTKGEQQEEMDEIRFRILGPLSADDVRLVSHVKKFHLHSPSTKPYNLTNGVDATYKKYLKAGTWSFIHFYLQALFPNEGPGFFVEAGALDGEFLSNTLWLEQTFGWTGLLIESDKESFHHLQSKHRRAWTSNTCLSKDPFPKQTVHVSLHAKNIVNIPWIYHANSHELGITKKIQNHKFSMQSDQSYSVVQCFPLITFLKALNVSTVDFLSLDTEGSEKEILQNFLWDSVKIRVMVVEIVNNSLDEDFVNFMDDKGYVLMNREDAPVIHDYLFIRKDEKGFLETLQRYAIRLGPNNVLYTNVSKYYYVKEGTN